jgi:hypothetical protein
LLIMGHRGTVAPAQVKPRKQGFHHGDAENTEKALMRFARCVNKLPRAAPKVLLLRVLRGEILTCFLQSAAPVRSKVNDCRAWNQSAPAETVE